MHILITFDYKTHYQVQAMERKIKHKLRPQNAFGLAKDLDVPASCPREELHQFLIGVYGEYILPSSVYRFNQVLRAPELYLSPTRPLVSDQMLRGVWTRLRDRLSSLDSDSSILHVTPAYAAHFIDMYVDKHTGKHLTGDRIRVLLLTLPFLLRDLIAPEVERDCYTCSLCIHKSIHMNHI